MDRIALATSAYDCAYARQRSRMARRTAGLFAAMREGVNYPTARMIAHFRYARVRKLGDAAFITVEFR
jgi:hypothetical protein